MYGIIQRQEGAGAPLHRLTCHCAERGDVAPCARSARKCPWGAISQYPVGSHRKTPAKSQLPPRDCTPRALPRASRSGRHVASLLAMTNRGPLPFYRYPIRIGGAAPGAACRSPTAHGRRSVYFSFFIFQSSVFISMRPSPTTHYRFLASGVDFSCASCSARMMRFETSQPRGVRYQREPLCAARPCAAKRSSSCCSGAKGSR